ncbi:hypothetical protein SAMN04487934_11342 [Eubacterium ruminantium]|nr:hypothetical protein SAMN04487934_11342 [Eubacterium ruminantium]
MITKENYSEEHIRQIQNDSHRDPLLIERTLFAFGLLVSPMQYGILRCLFRRKL